MIYTILTAIAGFITGSTITAILAAHHDRKPTSPATTGEDMAARILDLETRLREGAECILRLTNQIHEQHKTIRLLENDKILLAESCETEIAELKRQLTATASTTTVQRGISADILRVLTEREGKWMDIRQLMAAIPGKPVKCYQNAIRRLYLAGKIRRSRRGGKLNRYAIPAK